MTTRANRTTAQWVANPAIRGTIQAPPDVRGAAYIVAVIRALLLDDRLTARDDYRELIAIVTPQVQAIKAEAEGLDFDDAVMGQITEKGKSSWWLRDFVLFRASDVFRKWRSTAGRGGFQAFEAFDGKAGEFARRWLFGSEPGRRVLWALATVDASGVDPLAVEWHRKEHSPTYVAAYGEHKTRLSRWEHKQVMESLKKRGWQRLEDGPLLKSAVAWVAVHHSYGGHLSRWLFECSPEQPLADDVSKWSARLKPFDVAVGRPRLRGWPSERRKSV